MIKSGLTHGDAILLKDGDKIIDLVKHAHLLNNSYIIPHWCEMGIGDHFDGMGGCWSISGGMVVKNGGAGCSQCDMVNVEKHNLAMSGEMPVVQNALAEIGKDIWKDAIDTNDG